jgi:hypothetical protein
MPLNPANCNANNAYDGCSVDDARSSSYGSGFNSGNGGVYVMQWTSSGIYTWFFPRSSIPNDITSGNPNPANWGSPAAKFTNAACNIDAHFTNHQIVINTSLCGDWGKSRTLLRGISIHLPRWLKHFVDTKSFEANSSSTAGTVWNNGACAAQYGGSCNNFVANNPSAFSNAYWTINSLRVYQ